MREIWTGLHHLGYWTGIRIPVRQVKEFVAYCYLEEECGRPHESVRSKGERGFKRLIRRKGARGRLSENHCLNGPLLMLDTRGRPSHLRCRIAPVKRGARPDTTAKAEGAHRDSLQKTINACSYRVYAWRAQIPDEPFKPKSKKRGSKKQRIQVPKSETG